MKRGTLFIKATDMLEDMAYRVAEIGGLSHVQLRYSDNYPEGIYYKLEKADAQATLTSADHSDFNDFDYWLSIRFNNESDAIVKSLTESIAKKLALAGFETAIAINPTRIGGGRILCKRRLLPGTNEYEVEFSTG